MTSHHKEKEAPTGYVLTRDVKVPSGRILLDLKRGQLISDPAQLKVLETAFEGNPPLRPVHPLDLV